VCWLELKRYYSTRDLYTTTSRNNNIGLLQRILSYDPTRYSFCEKHCKNSSARDLKVKTTNRTNTMRDVATNRDVEWQHNVFKTGSRKSIVVVVSRKPIVVTRSFRDGVLEK